MIIDHKWRPAMIGTRENRLAPWGRRLCEFMNCQRPAAEHAQAVNPVRSSRRRKVEA
jgi:hypothetical protein